MAAALMLTACTAPVAEAPRAAEALRVPGLWHWQGADARRAADAACGARGVRVSIYDRYQAGDWVFPEGCA
ncbi:MAG: hypothetical protein ACK4GO_09075 [Gemmobacter sp.]